LGELYLEGTFNCYTLEPPKLDPPVKPRCIPASTYRFTIAFSPKHNRDVPLLEAVPDFEEIEIHIGNFPADTLGCILVGKQQNVNAIYESTLAFEELFPKLSPGIIQITEET
jgi:hypothetical protein